MTSKNKTSQPDNTPAAEDTSSDQKTLDAQAAEAVDTAGEKTDELEEVTDPIAADMAAADEDYIMEIVSPIFPGLDEDGEEDETYSASDENSPEIKQGSFKSRPGVEPRAFTSDLLRRLRSLYTQ